MKITTQGRPTLVLTAFALLLAACGNSDGNGGGSVAKGNAAHGKELYAQCAGCHQLDKNLVGPMHCGVIGRAAGSVPDFEYSDAMKDSGITWDETSLDEFLRSPIAYVNGTKMGFAGFDSATDRADVIAYLRESGNDPAICPPN